MRYPLSRSTVGTEVLYAFSKELASEPRGEDQSQSSTGLRQVRQGSPEVGFDLRHPFRCPKIRGHSLKWVENGATVSAFCVGNLFNRFDSFKQCPQLS